MSYMMFPASGSCMQEYRQEYRQSPIISSTNSSPKAGAGCAGIYPPVSNALGSDQTLQLLQPCPLNPSSQGTVTFPWHVPLGVDMEQHSKEAL